MLEEEFSDEEEYEDAEEASRDAAALNFLNNITLSPPGSVASSSAGAPSLGRRLSRRRSLLASASAQTPPRDTRNTPPPPPPEPPPPDPKPPVSHVKYRSKLHAEAATATATATTTTAAGDGGEGSRAVAEAKEPEGTTAAEGGPAAKPTTRRHKDQARTTTETAAATDTAAAAAAAATTTTTTTTTATSYGSKRHNSSNKRSNKNGAGAVTDSTDKSGDSSGSSSRKKKWKDKKKRDRTNKKGSSSNSRDAKGAVHVIISTKEHKDSSSESRRKRERDHKHKHKRNTSEHKHEKEPVVCIPTPKLTSSSEHRMKRRSSSSLSRGKRKFKSRGSSNNSQPGTVPAGDKSGSESTKTRSEGDEDDVRTTGRKRNRFGNAGRGTNVVQICGETTSSTTTTHEIDSGLDGSRTQQALSFLNNISFGQSHSPRRVPASLGGHSAEVMVESTPVPLPTGVGDSGTRNSKNTGSLQIPSDVSNTGDEEGVLALVVGDKMNRQYITRVSTVGSASNSSNIPAHLAYTGTRLSDGAATNSALNLYGKDKLGRVLLGTNSAFSTRPKTPNQGSATSGAGVGTGGGGSDDGVIESKVSSAGKGEGSEQTTIPSTSEIVSATSTCVDNMSPTSESKQRSRGTQVPKPLEGSTSDTHKSQSSKEKNPENEGSSVKRSRIEKDTKKSGRSKPVDLSASSPNKDSKRIDTNETTSNSSHKRRNGLDLPRSPIKVHARGTKPKSSSSSPKLPLEAVPVIIRKSAHSSSSGKIKSNKSSPKNKHQSSSHHNPSGCQRSEVDDTQIHKSVNTSDNLYVVETKVEVPFSVAMKQPIPLTPKTKPSGIAQALSSETVSKDPLTEKPESDAPKASCPVLLNPIGDGIHVDVLRTASRNLRIPFQTQDTSSPRLSPTTKLHTGQACNVIKQYLDHNKGPSKVYFTVSKMQPFAIYSFKHPKFKGKGRWLKPVDDNVHDEVVDQSNDELLTPEWATTNGSQATLSYDPRTFDDPSLKVGRHITVMSLASFKSSIVPFVRPAELKTELNEKFREMNPNIHSTVTLSSLRSIKQKILQISQQMNLDLSTVALSYCLIEKLVIKGAADKNNLKRYAGVCLVLATKFNQQVHFSTLQDLFAVLDKDLGVTPEEIRASEFPVFTKLSFGLFAKRSDVMVHYDRLKQAIRKKEKKKKSNESASGSSET
ncbi:Cables2 protein [Pelomyxa schiedti]|nr:Cables2 protein [Pelomyxa schiedti]